MKLFKKLASFILAFAMVAAIAMPSVVMAASNNSIIITGANAGHTFEAYQIFKGDLSGSTLSNIEWGSGVDSSELGDAKDSAKNLTEANAAEFASKVAGHLTTPSGTTSTYSDKKYVISNLEPGYYLVKDKENSVKGSETYTKFILRVVGNETVAVKSDVPTSEKKVKDINDTEDTTTTDWQDSADWDIGDDVPFQLTGTVSNKLNDYKGAYKLVFHDKESEGLTFNNDITVKVGKNTIDPSNYVVKTEGLSDDCTFEVIFNDLRNVDGVTPGCTITVEYTSKLNTEAKIGSEGNPNTMHMEFSNNPNVSQDGTTGETPDDTVIVFTYKTVINKVDENEKSLEGAAFKLEKKNKNGTTSLVKEFKVEEGKTSFEFVGLDDGEYILTETTTPDGYNTMEPITFKITADHETTSDYPKLTDLNGNRVTGEISFTKDLSKGSLSAKVVNHKGSTLPSTGGMGTTVLYVAGTLMIIAAAAFLVMKKKAENK